MDKFWTIVTIDRRLQTITPFTTEEKAKKAAMQLAKNSDKSFYVLEAQIAYKSPITMVTETIL